MSLATRWGHRPSAGATVHPAPGTSALSPSPREVRVRLGQAGGRDPAAVLEDESSGLRTACGQGHGAGDPVGPDGAGIGRIWRDSCRRVPSEVTAPFGLSSTACHPLGGTQQQGQHQHTGKGGTTAALPGLEGGILGGAVP